MDTNKKDSGTQLAYAALDDVPQAKADAKEIVGLVKSGGDVGFVFKMDTIFVFLIVLPSAMITAYLGLPAWVVFACLKCDQILKCFVAVVKINSFNWMKNLTRENAA